MNEVQARKPSEPFIIRPKRPFDPSLVDANATIWRGRTRGSGNAGLWEVDERSLEIPAFDVSQFVLYESPRGKGSFGEAIHAQLEEKRSELIRVDPTVALALAMAPDKWLPAWNELVLFFDGITMRNARGQRSSVYAYKKNGEVRVRLRVLNVPRETNCRSVLYPTTALRSA